MAFGFYHDPDLLDPIEAGDELITEHDASTGGYVDKRIYFGDPTSGYKAEASSNPGIDPITVSIVDNDTTNTHSPDGTGLGSYMKLALKQADLDSTAISPGASLDIGTTVYSGFADFTGEILGVGDTAGTTLFPGTLQNHPVKPSSITISYTIDGASYTATDDGNGNISGPNLSGTIDYYTGDYDLTFSTAPDAGTNITADYTRGAVPIWVRVYEPIQDVTNWTDWTLETNELKITAV